ncbi:hypothetical protein AVEN_6391-1 [Araneus ventricosus]|uniref:Uncharacterized protein n=1 Tax=Araneus ventricosus TaxID=182803 RepID=A0A4Y2VJG5_ARAVE|nr:hypothetical protein AVEN_257019-1 [Araneus ventricosus]GBO24509.1 hypothetical protein AVEN_6391-1 [Araneus ventricosus]
MKSGCLSLILIIGLTFTAFCLADGERCPAGRNSKESSQISFSNESNSDSGSSEYSNERKRIRELAVRRILGARDKKTKNSGGFRFLKVPKLNFEAADYIDLIDWSNCVVTVSPLSMHIKDKALKEMCKEEQFPALTFRNFHVTRNLLNDVLN